MLKNEIERTIRALNPSSRIISLPPDIGFSVNDVIRIKQYDENTLILRRVARIEKTEIRKGI